MEEDPIVGDFERILKASVLLLGFGLPGENAHVLDEAQRRELRKGCGCSGAVGGTGEGVRNLTEEGVAARREAPPYYFTVVVFSSC